MFDNDIAKYVDAFNLHTYETPSNLRAWTADLRRFLEEAGVPDFQVWLTEYGTNLEGHGERESGREGIRAHSPEQELKMAEICPKGMVLLQFGGIRRAWWFLFGCYNERHGEKDWGTMRRDSSVKPICAALATLNRLLGGAKMLGEVHIGEGVRAFLYEAGEPPTTRQQADNSKGTQTLVFWRETAVDAGSRALPADALDPEFSITAANGHYRLVDVMGTPSETTAANGALHLVATPHPQFATGPYTTSNCPKSAPSRATAWSCAPTARSSPASP